MTDHTADEVFDAIQQHQRHIIGDKDIILLTGRGFFEPVIVVTREEWPAIYKVSKQGRTQLLKFLMKFKGMLYF